ncbi:MAG: hypothetical protein AAGA30_21380 [Planctomycetota bacterium]
MEIVVEIESATYGESEVFQTSVFNRFLDKSTNGDRALQNDPSDRLLHEKSSF